MISDASKIKTQHYRNVHLLDGKYMKSSKFARLFIAIIATGAVCLTMASCDPDVVDAFADGYRDGYYGSRAEAANNIEGNVEATDTYTNAE